MKVERLEKVIAALKKKAAEAQEASKVSVAVGYTAAYALYVHENLEMKLAGQPRRSGTGKGLYWDPQGQAQSKFLEQPARELSNSGDLVRIVLEVLSKGGTFSQALVAAGMRIQRESMLLCPVDTGLLKASAFTTLESGGGGE
jgi:hypothetical protein